MPVSKRRKPPQKKRVPKLPTPVTTEKWARKLHSSRLMHLRDDPDFLTMIKVGRVMNAVSFCVCDLANYREERTVAETRQNRRAIFLLGGYLHQAITLVDRIKGRYLGDPAFEFLRVLVVEQRYRKIRNYAKKVRNYTAFHLDEYDETTRSTLAHLKPQTYTLMCGDDGTYGAFYFEFSDYLDFSFIAEEFADGRPGHDVAEEIVHSLFDYAMEFLQASHTFLHMLWEKKVMEHAYVTSHR